MEHSEELSFDVEMELQEDIGAELDYFILLTLLGMDDEAQEFASTTLWSHLQHFPVLAEVAYHFVTRNNLEGLKRLLNHVKEVNITFDDPEEELFLTLMHFIDADQNTAAHTWHRGAADLIREFDGWTSETSCLILEIQLTVATRSVAGSPWNFVKIVMDYCLELQHQHMFEQSARVFWVACSAGLKRSTYGDEVYQRLASFLQRDSDPAYHSSDSMEVDNRHVYALLNNISFIHILWKATYAAWIETPGGPPEELVQNTKEILRKIDKSLYAIFDGLPNSTPRGRHVMFCENLRRTLKKIERDVRVIPAAPAFADVKLLSSVFPISLVSGFVGPDEMQVERAVQSDKINFNILSQSFANMHQVPYEPCSTFIREYHIIGYFELALIWRNSETSESIQEDHFDYWYITPDELPSKAQAMISALSVPPIPPNSSPVDNKDLTKAGVAAASKGQAAKLGQALNTDAMHKGRMLKTLMDMGWSFRQSRAGVDRFDSSWMQEASDYLLSLLRNDLSTHTADQRARVSVKPVTDQKIERNLFDPFYSSQLGDATRGVSEGQGWIPI